MLVSSHGGEIRDEKPSTCRATLFRCKVFGRRFAFFTSRDQLVAQQELLMRIEEICCEK